MYLAETPCYYTLYFSLLAFRVDGQASEWVGRERGKIMEQLFYRNIISGTSVLLYSGKI